MGSELLCGPGGWTGQWTTQTPGWSGMSMRGALEKLSRLVTATYPKQPHGSERDGYRREVPVGAGRKQIKRRKGRHSGTGTGTGSGATGKTRDKGKLLAGKSLVTLVNKSCPQG